MNNEDLQRLYDVGTDLGRPGDFVRRDKNGKIPGADTTLNKYTYAVYTKPSIAQVTKILNVLNSAKKIGKIEISSKDGTQSFATNSLLPNVWGGNYINAYSNVYIVYSATLRNDIGASGISERKTEFKDSAFSTSEIAMTGVQIIYFNDTEITE